MEDGRDGGDKGGRRKKERERGIERGIKGWGEVGGEIRRVGKCEKDNVKNIKTQSTIISYQFNLIF